MKRREWVRSPLGRQREVAGAHPAAGGFGVRLRTAFRVSFIGGGRICTAEGKFTFGIAVIRAVVSVRTRNIRAPKRSPNLPFPQPLQVDMAAQTTAFERPGEILPVDVVSV